MEKYSLVLWKKRGKLQDFFFLLCGHPVLWQLTVSTDAQLLRQFTELLFKGGDDNDGDEFPVGTVC